MEEKEILKLIDRKLKPLNDKIEKFEKSLDFISNQYDDLYKALNGKSQTKPGNEAEQSQTTPDGDLNQRINKIIADVQDYSNQIAMLKESLNEQEQYTQRDCLEIRGLPATTTENTNDLVKSVGKLIGVEIKDNDISTSHWLKASRDDASNKRDPAIIVKFTRRDIKNKMYTARKNLRSKSSRDLGFTRHNESKIFLVEILTQTNKILFNETLKVKKELHFKFIWTTNGKIHLRKDITHPVINITSARVLQKVREKHATQPSGSRHYKISIVNNSMDYHK